MRPPSVRDYFKLRAPTFRFGVLAYGAGEGSWYTVWCTPQELHHASARHMRSAWPDPGIHFEGLQSPFLMPHTQRQHVFWIRVLVFSLYDVWSGTLYMLVRLR